jgi:hypothetical protein
MERHDSLPEEQLWRFAGCDLDHIIRVNSILQGSGKDAREKRARNALLIDRENLAYFWPGKEPGGFDPAVKTVSGVLDWPGRGWRHPPARDARTESARQSEA